MRYRPPTRTRGLIQIRTLQVISPRRMPSRSRFVNTMKRVYDQGRHRVQEKLSGGGNSVFVAVPGGRCDETNKPKERPSRGNSKVRRHRLGCDMGTKAGKIAYTSRGAGLSRRQTIVKREEL